MTSLRIGKIRAHELQRYQTLTWQHLGIAFPLEYLRGSRIRIVRAPDGQILGGYAIVTEGPLRVLQSIPGTQPFTLTTRTAEITGLWLDRRVRGTKVSARLWLTLWLDAVTCGCNAFVFAYASANAQLDRMYKCFNRTVIFQGRTKILPGMPHEEIETVAFISRLRLLALPAVRVRFLLGRFFSRAAAPRRLTDACRTVS